MTTTTDAATQIADIQAGYVRVAQPALIRLVEIAGTIRDELRSRFRNPESAAKQMSSVEGIPALVRERASLLADIGQAQSGTRMVLDRWLEEQRMAQRRAQAHDPEFDSPEGQQRKLLQLAQADELSSLPANELLADARRYLEAGDVAAAQIRLKAAKLAGVNRPGQVRTVQEGIDAELDRTQPHRIAAAEQMKAALAAYRDVLTTLIRTEVLAGNLAKAAPTEPDDEIAQALEWAEVMA